VLPEGTPKDIVDAYRAAVRQMLKDPEYLAKRDEIIGEYEQVTDKAGEELYKSATSISPEAKAWVRDFLIKNYQVKFE
jgi:tripartite-type tricarboxylate transporter receptor subunit TctC